jgi:ribosome-associated protein
MRDVILRNEPVELHKILKFEGMVSSGGVAKLAIESGDVKVNGEVETRKRKKMVSGDIIEFNGEQIRLVAAV